LAIEPTRITFNFDIVPVACGRPRLGRFVTFNPPKTTDYKKTLTAILHLQLQAGTIQADITKLYDKPIALTATFGMPIPKRLIRKKEPQPWRAELPVTRPDFDNQIKSVTDILTGVVYKDDSQITHASIRKVYSERPFVKITVQEATIKTNIEIYDCGN
jgi:Holliday junction resolvase RusA-like endonuclease